MANNIQMLMTDEEWMVNGEKEIEISSDDDSLEINEGECKSKLTEYPSLWKDCNIWEELQALPNADKTISLINNDEIQELVSKDDYLRTGVLFACWNNNTSVLKELLKAKANPNMYDEYGRTALHLAAFQGHAECIQLLIDARVNVTKWDKVKKATPLHCAASRGCISCVRKLIKAGADVNAGLNNLMAQSPLHYAVQSNAIDCIQELLEAGACPNTAQVFTETPLHVAAAMGYPNCIKLLLQYGADPRVQYGSGKITALHLAAEDDNSECIKLLLEAGANIDAENHKKQTPLHLAALAQATEVLEILLQKGANPNKADENGRTPLHASIVKVSRCCECVKLLLKAGAIVNKADVYGYTPLHIAALNEFSYCVLLLINYGGDITAKTNGGASVLSFIVRRTPDIIPKYINKLDASIKLTDHDIGDVDCELKLDFKQLVPCVGRGETELLLNFIEVGQKVILKHPLCETFLYLKWKRIRKYFLFSLLYHIIYVFLYTTYISQVYMKNCPNESNTTNTNEKICKIDLYVIIIGYILLLLNILSLSKELFQIAHNWKSYYRHWENWLQWLTIICVFLCVVPRAEDNIKKLIYTWQHHVAAIGIFLAWIEIMMIVGRFPVFGLYFQMFTTVTLNFLKCLLAYSSLLIAFSLSFGVLLANYSQFSNIGISLIKTFIMMSGELEFEDTFFPNDGSTEIDDKNNKLQYEYTVHIMFLLFVLLVTVLLTNLMMGLAVSDIQELQQTAGLDRLVRQTELIAHLESMLFSRLLQYVPNKILRLCHRSALLLTSHYRWIFYIRPNDPRENRLPRDLIKNIYKLVAERKPKVRFKKSSFKDGYNKKCNRDSSFYRSESELRVMSRMYSYNSADNLNNLKPQIDSINEEIEQFSNTIQIKLNHIYSTISSIKNSK